MLNKEKKIQSKTPLQETRLHLVQAYYGYLIHDHGNFIDFEKNLQNIELNEHSDEINKEHLIKFMKMFEISPPNNEQLISQHLKEGWTIDKMDILLRAIIILAIYEIQHFGDQSIKSIINDYVTISGFFYLEKEIGFVNGILDKIAKKIRE